MRPAWSSPSRPALLLLRELWRTLTGRMTEAELVMVQESEDLASRADARADGADKR